MSMAAQRITGPKERLVTSHSAERALVPAAADEGLHEPDANAAWSESHYLDTVSPDAASGAYVRLGRLPNQGRSHVMLAVVRPGTGPVILADPDAPLPVHDGTDLEVTAGAYGLKLTWDAPLRQLHVSALGTATGYDDPADVLRRAPGRGADVDLDLTWHTDGTPFHWRGQTRYEIPCHVTGHVTVNGERTDIDWAGQRDHSWGARDWWALEWSWMAVHLDDGSRWHSASVPAYPGNGAGYYQLDGEVTELTSITSTSPRTADGLFGTTTVRIEPGGHTLRLSPAGFAPARMDSDDGRVSFFPRATCRVATADGRRGIGWVEWNFLQDG
jgi:hypothetical protein